jgi:cupin fold WbuC family metalloprotein
MQTRKINDEVYYAYDDIVCVKRDNIEELKSIAEKNIRKRTRLCAHPDEGNILHEMFIILGKENYIRPHRHLHKSESFHVIEGSADIILFDDRGTPIQRIELGDYSSGRRFYFRIDRSIFHTVVVISACFVFHETTNGPFNRSDTEFALWAPEEIHVSAGNLFLCDSLKRIGGAHDS